MEVTINQITPNPDNLVVVHKPEFSLDYSQPIEAQVSAFVEKLKIYHTQPCLAGFVTEKVYLAIGLKSQQHYIYIQVVADLLELRRIHPVGELNLAIYDILCEMDANIQEFEQ